MAAYQQKLERIFQVSLQVSDVKDIDVLMERILTEARGLVGADAGSIYLKDRENLRFSYTQNDTLLQRLETGRKLPFATFTIPINSDSLAGYVAATGELLNLPDVYNLPPNSPYAFDTKFDELSRYRTQAVLTIPLKDARNEVIGVLQLINPRDETSGVIVPFEAGDIPLFMHFANNAAVALERAQLTRSTILRMISMAEMRDPFETAAHANRVACYSLEIFETWAGRRSMPPREIDTLKDILRIAAILHDVGKIAISDTILQKPGRLTPEEFETMKMHTYFGAKLFSDSASELDRAACSVALSHHERWDGTGYPGNINMQTGLPNAGRAQPTSGRVGNTIPVFGRIVAIADVYDALLTRRSYKEAWEEEKAITAIREGAGSHFDPEMVDAFLSSLASINDASKRLELSA